MERLNLYDPQMRLQIALALHKYSSMNPFLDMLMSFAIDCPNGLQDGLRGARFLNLQTGREAWQRYHKTVAWINEPESAFIRNEVIRMIGAEK